MKISIIIPVYKERDNINITLEKLYQLNNSDIEIIVVDAEQNGQTLEVITFSEVKKVISEKGRSKQMNTGASLAQGEILLFLHADTELPFNSIDKIRNIMSSNKYIAGAFDLSINSDKKIFRIIEKISSLRSRITRIPYGDQGIFIDKEFFLSTGKFNEFPLMEDVELMQRIKKTKKKIFIFKEKVKTSPRRWEKEGILFCTFRNWSLITLYLLGVSPEKLVKFYR